MHWYDQKCLLLVPAAGLLLRVEEPACTQTELSRGVSTSGLYLQFTVI